MSFEKNMEDIRYKFDKYLDTKIGKPIDNEEMTDVLADILEEYTEVPNFEIASVELLKEDKYPAIRYTIRRSE